MRKGVGFGRIPHAVILSEYTRLCGHPIDTMTMLIITGIGDQSTVR